MFISFQFICLILSSKNGSTCYHRIEELESHGIAAVDIKKLKAGGYHTIESVLYLTIYLYSSNSVVKIAHSTMRKLLEVKGISEPKALKLKDIIKQKNLVVGGFMSVINSRLSFK